MVDGPLIVVTLIMLCQTNDFSDAKKSAQNKMEKEAIMSRCSGCKKFAEKFLKGLEKTSGSNFGQEKANWEPRFTNEKLGNFAASETRLVEILDGVCDKDYYCNWVVSEFEEEIENWYYHKQQIFTDFANFLCVKKAKLCCPDDHYGPKCEACAALKCSLHGKCQGSGSRTGNGKCECEKGYTGGRCNKCASNYFGSNDSTCLACDPACNGCSGEGSDRCVDCTKGHIRTILSGNTCINLHRDLPSPTRLQLYLIGVHVVCLLLLTYASYIYKGSGFCKIVFFTLFSLMAAYHKLFYSKSLGPDGSPDQFAETILKGSEKN